MSEILGSFSFDVTRRVLKSLSETGPAKKTNLATRTGMNYSACSRYLEMLSALGWIRVTKGEVCITELGTEVMQRLDSVSQGYAKVISPRTDTERDVKGAHLNSQGERVASLASRVRSNRRMDHTKSEGFTVMHNVMIVDDEPEVALTYESFLNSTVSCKAKAFSEPYAALREFATNPPNYDLVVLDIRMPDINGVQLYQSLYAMNSACKFIFVSSLDSAKEILSVLPNIRPENIIRKPVTKEQFIQTVNALFRT